MNAFHQSIRRSIENKNLQQALDANAERRLKGRAGAFASLRNPDERRKRANAVRAEVIANLDSYVDQFIANAEKNGIIVHRAKDSTEALKIILGIVNGSPKLIAKSKSMISEEIELNHALEKAGHRVIETDLGEYIVQLRGEKPAHIITPAVHLRRSDVGKLFHEKIGIPYTENIPTLTNTARKILREVFLTADIGISGVNFGVAESGTFCIVTNEGNGRMVTTLPKVHIAMMGMERLVPTLEDLALMLSLLPRSATGQKLSVYTQLINRPLDPSTSLRAGNQTRHLVILDNGRTKLRSSNLHEALYCIRCGACLNACPVFRELGGHAYVGNDGIIAPYPGPIGSIISPGLLGENFVHLAQASSLCGACKDICPVGIDLPKLLTRVRAGETQNQGNGLNPVAKFGLQMYSRIARDPSLFSVSQKFAALTTFLVSPFSQWMRLPAFTGWGYSKDFPRFANKSFRARWKDINHRVAENTEKEFKQKENPSELRDSVVQKNKIEQFSEELTALGGNVYRVTQENLNAELLKFLREKNVEDVAMWEKVSGVDEAYLTKAGIKLDRSDANLKVGITGATSAVAETGTLVIASGAGESLTTSLLPEIHIAAIKSSQILETLEEALQLDEIKSSASIALISGPSRTADIEMTLTIGVHGPKEIHVFIVDD
jgi:L-lactate dehydrogenase complex protein LldF